MSDQLVDFEPDVDFSAAEAPSGFQFSPDGTTLNAIESDKFPPNVSQDVEGLLWLGYLTDTFDLYGHRFVIKTLTRGERLIVSQLVKEFENTLGLADAYETAQIAASLVMIDGMPLADIEPGEDPSRRIRENFERVKKWYDPVLAQLSERIVALNMRQAQAFIAFRSK